MACAPKLAEKIGDVDVIITAEAKGLALAYEISRLLGKKNFIVARKSIKSYMSGVVSVSVHSITTSGEQHLYLDGHDAECLRGKRVCIVDDVISTGESLYALPVSYTHLDVYKRQGLYKRRTSGIYQLQSTGKRQMDPPSVCGRRYYRGKYEQVFQKCIYFMCRNCWTSHHHKRNCIFPAQSAREQKARCRCIQP